MRKERAKDGFNVWLTDDDLEALRRAAASRRDDLIIQLGGYVGLRAFEIPQVQPRHVRRADDGEHYRLRVPEAKIRNTAKVNRAMPTSPATSSVTYTSLLVITI